MRIKNIQSQQSDYRNKNISCKGGREVLRTFSDPDSLMQTIFLESFVTGGRGKKAYERNGFPELRERATDDIISAVFWMKGVDIFNKLGNKFGEKVLKLPTVNFDVGKDELRDPFQNVISDINVNSNFKQAASLEKKLAAFKFTKIVVSSLLAVGFVGFALPKINQTITEKIMNKNKKNTNIEQKSSASSEEVSKSQPAKDDKELSVKKQYNVMKSCTFEEFEEKINKNKIQSFKGASSQMMTTVAHYLENNKICKMLTCDLGILTGRVKTARDPDEGREYFFRDSTSSFFYFASTPLIYKFLQKITGSSQITSIDPVAAKQLNEELLKQLQNTDGSYGAMNVKDFASKTIGILDDKSKELISKLPFKSDVISLKELGNYIKDEALLTKAEQMAELQPAKAGVGKVLTKQQVTDVFKNGSINTPDFMQTVYGAKFGKDLTDPYKYIPMKKITKFRDNIDKYVQNITDTAAKKNGGVVDKKLLNRINKKSFAMSAGFRAIALGISAVALGFVIPTLQYAITEKRTGKNEAPGLRKYNQENEKS